MSQKARRYKRALNAEIRIKGRTRRIAIVAINEGDDLGRGWGRGEIMLLTRLIDLFIKRNQILGITRIVNGEIIKSQAHTGCRLHPVIPIIRSGWPYM